MSSVFTSVETGSHVGNTIDDALLGINMRSHHNRTHEGSEFREVMEQIGTNSLRFPGGTVTEEHFDITDPDATRVTNVMHLIHPELIPERTNGVPVTRTVTPLSDYLSYVNEIGGAPIVVLPTYRFFDLNTRTLTANAETDIRTFVRDLFNDEYGQVDEATLEIGNEYFQYNRFDWSQGEFGALQARIAGIIDDELRDLGVREDATVLAQGGHVRNNNPSTTQANNAELASHFSGLPAGTVDGVVLHFYGTNSGSSDPLAMVPNIPAMLSGTDVAWRGVMGGDFDIAVTEWNVGESGPNTTGVNGLARTAPLLDMFAQMVRGGVDAAQIWAARVDGPAGLAMRSESADELTPTGHFFDMLAESTHGLNLVDPGSTGHLLRNASGTHVGYTYTFEGDDQGNHRSVTYFASGVGQTLALTADLSAQIQNGAYVYARILDVAPGDAVNGYYSDGVVSYSTDIQLIPTAGGLRYEAELRAYQLIELHVVHGKGVTIEGGREVKSNDNLVGSDFADEIRGFDGHDKLRGEAGDDLMDGGLGADVLRGNAGTDMLLGGAGRDRLIGGIGDDELHGGQGNDRLLGHHDNDLLWGEAGRDHLFGDNGDDVLFGGRGHDSLFGGDGADQLNGDAGMDLVQGDAGNDVIRGGGGADTVYGGADDDQLFGGMGSDTLDGGTGNDVLHGGGGADIFVFTDRGGQDRVLNFNAAVDRIDVRDFGFADAQAVFDRATDTAEGLVIDFDEGDTMTLVDVLKSSLTEDDFIF